MFRPLTHPLPSEDVETARLLHAQIKTRRQKQEDQDRAEEFFESKVEGWPGLLI